MNESDPETVRVREALAAWLSLTAPGVWITRAGVVFGLIALPRLQPTIHVSDTVVVVGAATLVLHFVTTALLMWNPGRWPLALLWFAGLGIDAFLCGVLWGGDPQLYAPGAALTLVLLAISLAAGGWFGASLSAVVVAAGAAVAIHWAVAPQVVIAPVLSLATKLSVETVFGGVAVAQNAELSFHTSLSVETVFNGSSAFAQSGFTFPTNLSVETIFGGTPAFGAGSDSFMPALALTLMALCAGIGVSLLRVRTTRAAVVAEMVAAGRLLFL